MPPTKSPGPANFTMKPLVGYTDHDFNSLKRRGPNWSLGRVLKNPIEYKSPGPALWNIEKFTRYGKSSSAGGFMGGSRKSSKPEYAAAPTCSPVQICQYKGICAPKYSMRMLIKPLTADPGPGPDAEPTSVNIYKNRSPKYPFLHKTKELTPDKVPGPNTYDMSKPKSKVMYENPAYTLRMKTRDPLAEYDKKPGAAEYNLQSYNPFDKYPTYSMRRKHCEYVHVPIVPFDNC